MDNHERSKDDNLEGRVNSQRRHHGQDLGRTLPALFSLSPRQLSQTMLGMAFASSSSSALSSGTGYDVRLFDLAAIHGDQWGGVGVEVTWV